MSTWKRWRAVVATAMAVVAMVPTPAMAWGDVRTLSPSDETALKPQMAVARDGTITVVWQALNENSRWMVRAIRRPSGGGWSDPVVISNPGVVNDEGRGPGIVVDRAGVVTVVWARRVSGESRIEAARHRPGEGWSDPTLVRETGWYVGMPDVAIDANGRIYVAWDRSRGLEPTEREVEVARRTSQGWSASTSVSDAAEQAEESQIVTDAEGNATVAWLRRSGPGDDPIYRLRAARRPDGETWGAPITLSGTSVGFFDLDADTGGAVAIGLQRLTDTNLIVEAIRRPPGGPWGEPRRLSRPGLPAFDLAIDASGGEILLALVQIVEETNYESRVLAARWADGSWRDLRAVSGRHGGLYGLELDFNSEGRALVAWTRDHDQYDGEDPETVRAAQLQGDGTWTDEVRLSSTERQSYLGDVVLRRSGNAYVVWDSIRSDYTGNTVIQFIQN